MASPYLTKEMISEARPTNNIPFSVAFPTRDLSSADYVKEMVHAGASYQVIPSTQHPFLFNYEEVLVGVILKTRNILLDIALPFYNSGNSEPQGMYFGRYLFYNQRLIAVRLCCASTKDSLDQLIYKEWTDGKVQTCKVPPCILRVYKESKFDERTYKTEIKVGDFMLSFNNLRIFLLFETEVKSKQNIISVCQNANVDVLSVISDGPREKFMESRLGPSNYNLSVPLINNLRQFVEKNKKIVIYGGCKLAPLNALYLSTSFILHHQLPENRAQPHFLSEGEVMLVVCHVEPGINPKLSSQAPSNIKPIHNIHVNSRLMELKKTGPGELKRILPSGSKYCGQIPEEMTNVLEKMRWWFIYNFANQRQPFIIPLPLNDFTSNLVTQIRQMIAYNNKKIAKFLIFFKTEGQQTYDIPDIPGVKCYESLPKLVQTQKKYKHFVYTDDESQAQKFSALVHERHSLYICRSNILKAQQDKDTVQLNAIETRMDRFCDRIVQEKLFNVETIIKANKKSPEPLTIDQLVTAMGQKIKFRMKLNFSTNPFYRFIVQRTRSQISMIFVDANERVKRMQSEQKNRVNRSSDKLNRSKSYINERERDIDRLTFEKVDKLKSAYNIDKNLTQWECHRCERYIPRSFVFNCQFCKIRTCFICIESIIKRPETVAGYLKECLICKKKCFCDKCASRNRNQQDKDYIPRKSKSFSNINVLPLETEQQKIQKEWQKQACQICMLEGRRSENIKILCKKCDAKGCYTCAKLKEKDRQFVKNWLCESCRPAQQRISSELDILKQIVEQDQREEEEAPIKVSPISGNIPEPIKYTMKSKQVRRRSRSNSRSVSPPRGSKRRSPSRSNSSQKRKVDNKRKHRSPSHSKSPPKNKKDEKKNTRKRSISNSKSPVIRGDRRKKETIEEKKRDRSRSRSISPKRGDKSKISRVKSRSRSGQSQGDKNRQRSGEEKKKESSAPLWGFKAKKKEGQEENEDQVGPDKKVIRRQDWMQDGKPEPNKEDDVKIIKGSKPRIQNIYRGGSIDY